MRRILIFLFLFIVFLAINIYAGNSNEWIVFDDYQIKNPSHLWKVHPDGTGKEQLTFSSENDYSPNFCKKGDWIVFVRNSGSYSNLYKIKIDGTNLTQLTHFTDMHIGDMPYWSSDCKKIYFEPYPVGGNGKEKEVYVINADGTDLKRLTFNDVHDGGAVDNPMDGYVYLDHGNDNIYKMDKNGNNLKLVFSNLGGNACLHFNSDGSKLLTLNTIFPNDLIIVDMKTSKKFNLTHGSVGDIDGADWSPDGTKIVFDAGNNNATNYLYIINSDGTGLHKLGNFYGHRPTWGFETNKECSTIGYTDDDLQKKYNEGFEEGKKEGYNNGYKAGIEYCKNHPNECGMSCESGTTTPSSCDATFNMFTNTLHIPCLRMDKSYWLDLELIKSNPVQLELKGFGENK